MKHFIINTVRKPSFQFIWQSLKHFSLVAMNHYGGSDLMESGELDVLNYVSSKMTAELNPVLFDVGANNGQYLQQSLALLPAQTCTSSN